MTVDIPTFDELYDAYRSEVESRDPDLTNWSVGSINDAMAGAGAVLVDELIRAVIDAFSAHFVDTAEDDDLKALALDRFGIPESTFEASAAVVPVTFTTTEAYVAIPAGTTVSGEVDGELVEFVVDSPATITSPLTTVDVDCTCTDTGSSGNIAAGVLDTVNDGAGVPLDSDITVTNAERAVGGAPEWSDERIRAYIRGWFQALVRGTVNAVETGALSVPSVTYATVDESEMGPDDGGHVLLYVGDQDGRSNTALIAAVEAVLPDWRACGVLVEVVGMARETTAIGVRVYVPSTLTERVGLRASIVEAIVGHAATLGAGESLYSSQVERATLDQDSRIVDAQSWVDPPYTAWTSIDPSSAENCLRVEAGDITIEFVEV
jgi:hypothetical protein